MCYNAHMDTTIRNLDQKTYRALKAQAALAGKTIGQMVNEAIAAYLARPELVKRGTLRDFVPEEYPAGNEHLSTDIDTIV